jgi:hypothetical protein
MSDHDHDPNSPFHKPEYLLDELESIKGLLGDDDPQLPADLPLSPDISLPPDIPLLDDMVIEHLDDNAQLLNLNRIFDDGSDGEGATPPVTPSVQFPRFQLDVAISDDTSSITASMPNSSSPPRPRVRPDYSRDILIQELIDEFVPQIESALRDRLAKFDTATLTKLKDK